MSGSTNTLQRVTGQAAGVPQAVASVLEGSVWSGEDLGRKAAMVVSGIVYGGRALKECAREAGLTVREARSLAREGWFGSLVSAAVGSKLGVMSEFRCARLRERMEMIEEMVDTAEDSDTKLKWLEQARKEMESGKGLESVIEALGSGGNSGPMIQVNIGRYESHANQPSREPAILVPESEINSETEFELVEAEVEDSGPQTSDFSQVAQREAAEECEESSLSIPIGYGPEDDSLDALLASVTRSK